MDNTCFQCIFSTALKLYRQIFRNFTCLPSNTTKRLISLKAYFKYLDL